MIGQRLGGMILMCTLTTAAVGCGRDDRPETSPVTGTVTLDGEPIEKALVAFYPDSGRCVGGYTDAEGNYELMYLEGVEGALLGHHRVEISTSRDPSDEDWTPGASKERIPPWYNARSVLEATVDEQANRIDFHLSTEPPEGWAKK